MADGPAGPGLETQPLIHTLAGPGQSRRTERRSHFLAYAAPLLDRAALQAWLQELRRQHPDARHCPYAWIGPEGQTALSDDGEPAGTGGRPCLAALIRRDLRQSGVAVCRLFGGVLLGAQLLGRTYGEAAEAAVKAAGLRTLRPWVRLALEVPYAELGAAEALLRRLQAADVTRTYGAAVTITAWVPLQALPQAADPPWRELGRAWR